MNFYATGVVARHYIRALLFVLLNTILYTFFYSSDA